MNEKKCKFCSVKFTPSVIPNGLSNIDDQVCDECFYEIQESVASSHPMRVYNIKLRINLRRLRSSLVKFQEHPSIVYDLIGIISDEIEAIECKILNLSMEYPELKDTLSEYRALVKLYK